MPKFTKPIISYIRSPAYSPSPPPPLRPAYYAALREEEANTTTTTANVHGAFATMGLEVVEYTIFKIVVARGFLQLYAAGVLKAVKDDVISNEIFREVLFKIDPTTLEGVGKNVRHPFLSYVGAEWEQAGGDVEHSASWLTPLLDSLVVLAAECFGKSSVNITTTRAAAKVHESRARDGSYLVFLTNFEKFQSKPKVLNLASPPHQPTIPAFSSWKLSPLNSDVLQHPGTYPRLNEHVLRPHGLWPPSLPGPSGIDDELGFQNPFFNTGYLALEPAFEYTPGYINRVNGGPLNLSAPTPFAESFEGETVPASPSDTGGPSKEASVV
ncbi:hypothetical protein C8R43DRAFT_1232648 [Mycena crocata]|nr:hypothetical protein C8R43DRAFT_1232648 [Mycena crocata]